MEVDKKFIAELITDVVSGLAALQCGIANLQDGHDLLAKINVSVVQQVLKRLNDKADLLLNSENENSGEKDGQTAAMQNR